jgi:hypothetical protein
VKAAWYRSNAANAALLFGLFLCPGLPLLSKTCALTAAKACGANARAAANGIKSADTKRYCRTSAGIALSVSEEAVRNDHSVSEGQRRDHSLLSGWILKQICI